VGSGPDGGRFELPLLSLVIAHDGRVSRVELFDPEDRNEAMRSFARWPAPRSLESVPENRAIRVVREVVELQMAHAWDAAAARHSPAVVLDDRRSGVRMRFEPDEGVADLLALIQGVEEIDLSPIATRGDRVCLVRVCFAGTVDGGGPFEVEVLEVFEVDEADRIAAEVVFDTANLDAAFDELDARFAAGEAASAPAAWEVMSEVVRSHSTGDGDRFAAQARDVTEVVDHRKLGWGQVTGERFEATSHDLTASSRMRCLAVPRLAPHGLVALLATSGDVPMGGGAWESEFVVLAHIEGHSARRLEFFGPEQLATAIARFDEAEPRLAPQPSNGASRLLGRFTELVLAKDWDALGERLGPDFAVVDRRSAFALEGDRGDMLQNLRAMAGITDVDWTVLATRGETLCLTPTTFRGGGGDAGEFEVSLLTVHEFDSDGLYRRQVTFEPEDLDGAFAELDERFEAGEGAPYAHVHAVGREAFGRWQRREWDDLAGVFDADAALVDRRPLGWGEITVTALVERWRVLAEMVPDGVLREVAVPGLNAKGMLSLMVGRGTTADGGEVEIAFHSLFVVSESKVERLEFLAADDLEEARARFEELTGTPVPAHLLNAASLLPARYAAARSAGDWEALGAMVHPDAEYDDRRATAHTALRGRDAFVSSARAMRWATEESAILATRGERLALVNLLFTGEGGDSGPFEVEILQINEVDEDGLLTSVVIFDPSDADAAFDELDARGLASADSATRAGMTAVIDMVQAFTAHDWERFRARIHPACVLVDHRPVSWGSLDRDGYVELTKSLVEMAPDAKVVAVAVPRQSPHGGVVVLHGHATTTEGNVIELTWAIAFHSRHGALTRIEYYDEADVDAAVARFDELAVENAVLGVVREVGRRQVAHDWAGVAALYSGQAVLDDRRAGVLLAVQGRDEIVGMARVQRQLDEVDIELLATRGEGMALLGGCFRGEAGGGRFELEVLTVVCLGADDRIAAQVLFDPEDAPAAFQELDRRFAEVAGSAAWDVVPTFTSGINDRDWDRLRGLASPEFRVDDHRPTGWGTLTVEQYIEHTEALLELAPDLRIQCLSVEALAPTAVVARFEGAGTTREGAEFEIAFLGLMTLEDALVVSADVYPLEGRALAMERFQAVTGSSS
jgi:hypothetical protein